MSLSGNSVNLPIGSYIVTYGATGSSDNANPGTLSIQLYANGVAIASETITGNSTSATPATVSKTILYNATEPTALSVHNSATNTTNYTSANITVQRLV